MGRVSRDFAGLSRRRPKSLRKKVSVQFLAPNLILRFGSDKTKRTLPMQHYLWQALATAVDFGMVFTSCTFTIAVRESV